MIQEINVPIYRTVIDDPQRGDRSVIYKCRSPRDGTKLGYRYIVIHEMLMFDQQKRIAMMDQKALHDIRKMLDQEVLKIISEL